MKTPPAPATPGDIRKGGCTFFFLLFLAGFAYWLYPLIKPGPGSDSIAVSVAQGTYLEGRIGKVGTDWMDTKAPYYSVQIYYTRSGGWFEADEQQHVATLQTRAEQYDDVGPIVFTREGTGEMAPIAVSCRTCQRFTFYPEKTPPSAR